MNAEPSRQQLHRRYRRRILSWGAVALIAVFVVGTVVTLPRVESDLEKRVDAAAADAGVVGVDASFSGQDGTLQCAEPLSTDALTESLLDELRDLRGVRQLEVEASCLSDGAPAENDDQVDTTTPPAETDPEVTTPAASTTAPSTSIDDPEGEVVDSVIDVLRNDSQFSAFVGLIDDVDLAALLAEDSPTTLFAPTNEALQELGPDVIAALGRDPELLASVLRHHITASTLVADDLVTGDIEMLDGTAIAISAGEAAVDAQITSGDSVAMLTTPDIEATNGVVHGIDSVLLPPGFELADPTPAPTTTGPEAADEEAAAQLEAELNALVESNPVLFEQGSAEITLASLPVLVQIAELSGQLSGVSIEVQGHTDTDGDPGRNQTLSEARAASVRDALVAGGIPADNIGSTGFGGSQTIVDANGVEDKAASRRVEFVVTVQ